ncbi:Glutamate receptor ionotropic, delta-1-like 34 [Homarus americanus]|uniref:Glutamate receptor ionotropic, delta-1-like 34 n=1 Tax=Homarus americanus TaxID=6706 RepID=A0A8J5NDK1_HOMAM|nr:Glutamate receptor ionotropic, delta-1-like 34 [Homarus americanus]
MRELWIALLTSVVVWGVLLWVLQGAWRWFARGHGVTFNTALLYSWGALLEQPPSVPSDNDSGKVLVGWWLVFCLVITTGFRSSLIAHLTVQGKSLPLDTFEDMVGRSNWKWGIETWNLKGVPYDYFTKHTDSVVKKVYQEMEVLDWQEGLLNVQEGGYTFISMVKHLTVIVASHYTDARGQTPFYISQRGVYSLPDYGWGFRKGAPFYTRFSTLMARLGDTGIMSYWIDDADDQSKGKFCLTYESKDVLLPALFTEHSPQTAESKGYQSEYYYLTLIFEQHFFSDPKWHKSSCSQAQELGCSQAQELGCSEHKSLVVHRHKRLFTAQAWLFTGTRAWLFTAQSLVVPGTRAVLSTELGCSQAQELGCSQAQELGCSQATP